MIEAVEDHDDVPAVVDEVQHLARLGGPAGGAGVDGLTHPPALVITPEADLLVTRPRAERLGLDQPILCVVHFVALVRFVANNGKAQTRRSRSRRRPVVRESSTLTSERKLRVATGT